MIRIYFSIPYVEPLISTLLCLYHTQTDKLRLSMDIKARYQESLEDFRLGNKEFADRSWFFWADRVR